MQICYFVPPALTSTRLCIVVVPRTHQQIPFTIAILNTQVRTLIFKSHVNAICKKAGQKLHAFWRISSYMNAEKLRIMMNAFVMSQFSFCPLTYCLLKINKINKRALRITYKDRGRFTFANSVRDFA